MHAVVTVLLVLGMARSLLGEESAVPSRVTSYEKNFLVISEDPAAVSWAAAEAEKIRRQILEEFQWDQKWKKPLILRLRSVEETRTRAELCRLIIARFFHRPPRWLQIGLERYFSELRDFHPDQMKEIRLAGKWLGLEMVLERDRPFSDAVWEDVFQREAACLVLFLKTRHPEILSGFRRERGDFGAVSALQDAWTAWIESSHPLLPAQPSVNTGTDLLQWHRPLARCLRIKVRDGEGRILVGDSAVALTDLAPCCKKDLARRRLLASYGELIKLARLDEKKISPARDYVACANWILAGEEFYDSFEALERRRLENTAHQR